MKSSNRFAAFFSTMFLAGRACRNTTLLYGRMSVHSPLDVLRRAEMPFDERAH
jgi:hypothetical protein